MVDALVLGTSVARRGGSSPFTHTIISYSNGEAMQVNEKKRDGLYAEFDVIVPAALVQDKIDQQLKKLAQKSKMPGFRPGKAPMAVIKQQYGDAVRYEAMEKAVEEATNTVLKDKNLKPALQPRLEVTKFNDDNTIEYTLRVETLPDIKIPDLSKVAVEKLVAKIEQEKIDEALDRVAKSNGETKEVSPARATQTGDIVTMDFDGSVHGEALPGMKAEGFELELGSGRFIEGFEEQMIGKKTGEEFVVNVTFPQDYGVEKLNGQPAEFKVTIHKISKREAAALDDVLAKKLGMESFDKVKDAIEKSLQRQYDDLADTRLRRNLLDALEGVCTFPIPAGMIDAEYNQIWQYHTEDLKSRGMDIAQAEGDEDAKAEFKKIAERRVKLGLLLSAIGEDQKLSVSPQELRQQVIREATMYGDRQNEVMKYYQKNPQALAALRAPIFEQKAIDYVLGQVKINEKEVDVATLTADPDEEKETKRTKKK
jgi:trigger factor